MHIHKLNQLKNLVKSKVLGHVPWEEQISINSFSSHQLTALPPASNYFTLEDAQNMWIEQEQRLDLSEESWRRHLEHDPYKIPAKADREGYYGENHLKYWASGLREMFTLTEFAKKYGVVINAYLDFGCASGRILRHFACQSQTQRICGVDLNRHHIDWISEYLPAACEVAQTTSIPHLPYEDNAFDLVSAFSVFTHIEAFETAWLLELKRILRPGGLAWVTVHSEDTWREMKPGWPLYDALSCHPDFIDHLHERHSLPRERLIFRQCLNRSYSSNVFYSTDYIKKVWGRILEPVEFMRRLPDFQDVVLLRKN